MGWPTITIEIAFTAVSIKSLSGAPWSDITSYVQRWGYRRGRQRQLQRAEAGTCYLELDNADGRFDPENSASPYYNGGPTEIANNALYEGAGLGMRPGRHIRIRATWDGVTYSLFYGYTTRWVPAELEGQREPTVRVEGADIMYWIGRGEQRTLNASSGQRTGEVIYQLLTDSPVNFSVTLTDIDAGTVTVQGLSTGDHNLLSTIQSYAESEEPGIFFVDGAGRFVYHDHLHRVARQRSIVRQATFDNDPTAQAAGALPFERVKYTRDDTELYNNIFVTRAGGTTQEAFSSMSYGRHGMRDLSRSTQHTADADAEWLARQLLNRFRRMVGQHTDLTLNGARDHDDLWPVILGLTISDQIRVTERLYPSYRSRTIDSFIEGMSVDVARSASTGWRVTFQLSPLLGDLHWKIGGKGTAFPASPSDNDLYYREDLDYLCYYDSALAAWLTVQEFDVPVQAFVAQPIAPPGLIVAGSINAALTHSRRLLAMRVTYLVNTTNNPFNFWTVSATDGATAATLASTSTGSTGPGIYGTAGLTLNVTNNNAIQLRVQANGIPGSIYAMASIRYRLIIT